MPKPPRLYLHATDQSKPARIVRPYDDAFVPTPAYRAALPDLMDAAGPALGSSVALPQVGVSNFKLLLPFGTKKGDPVTLEASITGTVSLEAARKGINMSRILRAFYEHRDEVFTLERLRSILEKYRHQAPALQARLRIQFSYPLAQRALRSGLEGSQFYLAAYEAAIDAQGQFRKFIEFDFVYSSACPCSAELAEHAREARGLYAVSHSQRSKARLKVEVAPRARLTIEDLHGHCLKALRTETQVMVKREDEQAFAELNGAYLKFVEDAARLLHRELDGDRRIADFQVICVHLESLHSHDAVSTICKGVPGGFVADVMDFRSLS